MFETVDEIADSQPKTEPSSKPIDGLGARARACVCVCACVRVCMRVCVRAWGGRLDPMTDCFDFIGMCILCVACDPPMRLMIEETAPIGVREALSFS